MTNSVKTKIIIIGAGMAGLTAAHYLQQMGKVKIQILEARNRIGGRIDTLEWDNFPIELGANFLIDSGTLNYPNPLVPLLRQQHLHSIPFNPLQAETFDPNGKPQTLENLLNLAHDHYHTAFKAIQKAKLENNHSASLSDILAFSKTPHNKPGTPEFIAQQTLTAMIEQHTGLAPKHVSLYTLLTNDHYEGSEQFIAGGYNTLLIHLAKILIATGNVSIQYNTTIKEIHYGLNNNQVLLKDHHQQEYVGNSVLCTVPLGVLKHRKLHFFPELSPKKTKALEHLEIGHHNVVALKFEKPFWKPDAPMLYPGSSHVQEWPTYVNLFHFSRQQTPTLLCHFYAEAAHFKTKSDMEILNLALAPLKRVYGNKVTSLVNSHITRWDSDPYTLGSTSGYSLKFNTADKQFLANQEPGGLFFAGAHTLSNANRETVQGAFLSGQRAALEILIYCKKKLNLKSNPNAAAAFKKKK